MPTAVGKTTTTGRRLTNARAVRHSPTQEYARSASSALRLTLPLVFASLIASLPPALEGALAVAGVFTAVLGILPAVVGFVGLVQRKKLDAIRDDATYAFYASVPAAAVLALAAIIYLIGA